MYQSHLATLIGPAAMLLVLAAAATDLHSRRIPNWLTFGAWLLALPVLMATTGALAGALAWTAGWLTGLAMFLPIYVLRGMAAGDVKLMAAVGAWLGAGMAFEIALAAFVLGGAWALAWALLRRRGRELGRNMLNILRAPGGWNPDRAKPGVLDPSMSVGAMPYGIAIAAGTIAMLFASA